MEPQMSSFQDGFLLNPDTIEQPETPVKLLDALAV
jgi:hypothetical protein